MADATPPLRSGKSPDPQTLHITFFTAFKFWLKLGFISFGGPAGQIAIMHEELVERRRWLSEKRFLHALNYCMLLPGPEAQQLAIYIGWLLHRTWGGIVAGVLFVLPSLFILITLSWVYIAFGDVSLVAGVFYGIKPAVTAIVLQAAWRIGNRALKNNLLWAVAIVAFLAIFAFDMPFPYIVVGAGLIGLAAGKWWSRVFGATATDAVTSSVSLALIDDHAPRADHTRFSWLRLATVLAVGILLWLLPMGALYAALGGDHTLTRMSWFFTTAAFLTFGGAYAVLPYVYQEAVGHYGWLSGSQVMDGLALGETTPGPLIMVVAFVGFVGAYVEGFFGPELRFIAGGLAAVLVTWFTFLPSFLFILLGGPMIESTHDNLTFTAPLATITAAVVGVILNLALFFGYHVLWPQGFAGQFDIYAALIAVVATMALFQFKRPVMEIIVLCAVLGLLITLWG